MATTITSECINCGACEPECPNTAIYQGAVEWLGTDGAMHPAISNDIFYIVPEKCTECVGFFDHEACAAVCPVDCCIPDPQRPETEAVLLDRARALHADKTFADDAPSRFRKEGAAADTPSASAAPAAPAPVAVAAPVAAAPVEAEVAGLAIPAPEEWDVPIRCFRCEGEYTVPFPEYRTGTVFRCPHCQQALVPTLSMVRAVGDALERFHGEWSATFEKFHAQRQREIDQFEERQRRALEAFQAELKTVAEREKAPGAPQKRRGFFTF